MPRLTPATPPLQRCPRGTNLGSGAFDSIRIRPRNRFLNPTFSTIRHVFKQNAGDAVFSIPGCKTVHADMSTASPSQASLNTRPETEEPTSCRECKRRRAKCDGTKPECIVCQKYRRHCLYDKHSRTRLTRKYEVPHDMPWCLGYPTTG